jgi:2-polyprenyl-3-methyl-5-hydroxy-6-metoxy-1,4-benzoquinol methylase
LTEEGMIRMENPEALFRTDVGSAVDLLKDRPFQSFQRAEMSGQIRRLATNTFRFFPMARFSLAKAALLISASPRASTHLVVASAWVRRAQCDKPSRRGEMRPEEKRQVAAHQRRRFNALVDVFDTPQPPQVMDRLSQIVSAARLRQGEVVLNVGSGVGVLVPLIKCYHASSILACDLAEKMLQRLREKYPDVPTHQADTAVLPLESTSVDALFLNAMYGNIADKPGACRNAARMLRPGGQLIVSHPEGRAFVDQLRVTSDLFVECLPNREEF